MAGGTSTAKELVKKFVFRHTKFGAPTYNYGTEPIQLAEIINGIERVFSQGQRGGSIVEIGVASGKTSRFIVEHILKQKYEVDFYCLDTFSSFTDADLEYEEKHRGKTRSSYVEFQYNDYEAWKRNFSEFPFVHPVQIDASDFDFSKIAPVHFCFLDVDFYVPTKNVLNNILPHMSENSVILVDDVADNNKWDGAYQAFMEFVQETGLKHRIVGNKCGMLYVGQYETS